MIQKEEIHGYSVIGYDKDNDTFICYGKFNTLESAVNEAKKLTKQLNKGELKRHCSDGKEEPMDWIEVYWNWNEDDEQILWGSL